MFQITLKYLNYFKLIYFSFKLIYYFFRQGCNLHFYILRAGRSLNNPTIVMFDPKLDFVK